MELDPTLPQVRLFLWQTKLPTLVPGHLPDPRDAKPLTEGMGGGRNLDACLHI